MRFCKHLGRGQARLKIPHKRALPFSNDLVAFLGKHASDFGDAARVFWVQFAVRFQRPPVRDRALFAGGGGFGGGMRGDPGENSSSDRTGDGRVVFLGEGLPELIHSYELAPRHAAHKCIDFHRRGNDESAAAPAFVFHGVDLADFGKIFAVRQFFLPGFLLSHHALKSKAEKERGVDTRPRR